MDETRDADSDPEGRPRSEAPHGEGRLKPYACVSGSGTRSASDGLYARRLDRPPRPGRRSPPGPAITPPRPPGAPRLSRRRRPRRPGPSTPGTGATRPPGGEPIHHRGRPGARRRRPVATEGPRPLPAGSQERACRARAAGPPARASASETARRRDRLRHRLAVPRRAAAAARRAALREHPADPGRHVVVRAPARPPTAGRPDLVGRPRLRQWPPPRRPGSPATADQTPSARRHGPPPPAAGGIEPREAAPGRPARRDGQKRGPPESAVVEDDQPSRAGGAAPSVARRGSRVHRETRPSPEKRDDGGPARLGQRGADRGGHAEAHHRLLGPAPPPPPPPDTEAAASGRPKMSCSPFSNVYDTSRAERPADGRAVPRRPRADPRTRRARTGRRPLAPGRVHVRPPSTGGPATTRPPRRAGRRERGRRSGPRRPGGATAGAACADGPNARRLDVDVHEVGPPASPVPAHAGRLPRAASRRRGPGRRARRPSRRAAPRNRPAQAEGLGNTLVDHAPARGRGQQLARRSRSASRTMAGPACAVLPRRPPATITGLRRPAQRGRPRRPARRGAGHRAGGVRTRASSPGVGTGSPSQASGGDPPRRPTAPGSRCTRGAFAFTAAPTAGPAPGSTRWNHLAKAGGQERRWSSSWKRAAAGDRGSHRPS